MTSNFFQDFYTKSPATCVIAALVLVFSSVSLVNKKLFFSFILHPQSVIREREYYRIFTADMVNVDIPHLVLNEFMLYVFCSDLEETLRKMGGSGSLEFLIIYIASLLFASITITARHFRNFNYSTTGTSGSIMGCMFGFMILAPNYIIFRLSDDGGIKCIYGGLIYIVLLIAYQRRKGSDMFNHEFHFYGAIGGILSTLALHPEIL